MQQQYQHSFLQSYEWERLQEMLGRKSWRINENLIIKHDLPRGFNYLYAPHLPGIDDDFLHRINEVALAEKSIFLKIDPLADSQNWKIDIRGWQFSNFIQPQKTTIIDLTKSEDELLGLMHYKTRYNINLSEKHGVGTFKCDRQDAKKYIDVFWELLTETAKRDIFSLHPKYYYQKLVGLQGEKFANCIVFAEYRGTILAAAIVNYYRDTVTYLHGASATFNRGLMAPYALHCG